ncbi:alkylation response protein AidB-like acyl-CoA dehydrogenase [Catenuloplanes nepalensis]|uniref:Alkylation response protein AidB-like acyl-CoA dehydrogenase n=1 Tax=Catenuloplanes nepalensis TaxID=587533 RepID=A0ABT9MV83_9ACTN|nr:acyl-CoA dehydrogenase family protein [Catenuloplanes nepalensis]MDP9795353.1 alkylation response protein AidB-like acyl-CoA dehydrogenase [Catenuloplanes nepalensis]
MTDAATMRSRAEQLAEEMFLPAAAEVDRAGRVPQSHLDMLRRFGFYGVAAPAEHGGLGMEDMATAAHLLEVLASGCLTTTLVWMQHHGVVLGTAASKTPGLRETWLHRLAAGDVRGGVALAGLRPGGEGMRARRVDSGYVLDGEVPWVSGWDMIDVVQVGARDDAGHAVFLLVDAVPSATLTGSVQDLAALRASRTAVLRFTEHLVPADRLMHALPLESWTRTEASGSALNGFLALGVVRRCCALLGPSSLDAELEAARAALLAADAEKTPAARATASELAVRAAATLITHSGSKAGLRGGHPERLLREAGMLLVYGTRPLIRDELLNRYSFRPTSAA